MQRHALIIRNADPDPDPDPWLCDAKPSLIASFAGGIIRNPAAVRAALTAPWSNGQTEGHVNRLELVKRRMSRRAKLDLIETRLIGAR